MPSLSRLLVIGLCAALAMGALAAPAGAKRHHHHHGGLSVTQSSFGNLPASMGGTAIDRYTLSNGRGMEVSIITYGGIIQSLRVPDRHGNDDNVTLGFKDIGGYTSPEYATSNPYF